MTSTRPVWTDTRSPRVLGTGSALPGEAVPTEALLNRIEERFGVAVIQRGRAFAEKLAIRSRHLVRDFAERREAPRDGDSNPDLATRAVRTALDQAGVTVGELDYLIGHTATPAMAIPSNVALVAERLGFEGPHMELRQACTGFANALVIAQGLLAGLQANGRVGRVAIVGSETPSVFFDPLSAGGDASQLVNLVQMGDGAGAIVLGTDDAACGARLFNVFLGQIGGGRAPGLSIRAGGSDHPFSDDHVIGADHDFEHVRESGPELFFRGAATALELGADPMVADHVLPHQASGRLGQQMSRYMGVPEERVFINADTRGNTGSAAIWLALAELRPRLAAGATVSVLGAEATKHMFGGFTYRHG